MALFEIMQKSHDPVLKNWIPTKYVWLTLKFCLENKMLQNKKQYDNDIDLTELFLIFWKYKITFALSMLIGLGLGLAFTYNQEPYHQTKFKITLGHPAYNESLLFLSNDLLRMLNQSELEPNIMPKISIVRNSDITGTTFLAEGPGSLDRDKITIRFKKILTSQLEEQRRFALMQSKSKTLIFQNTNQRLPSAVLANIPIDEILSRYSVLFSQTITTHPKPLRFSILGMTVGFFLAGCWMVLSLLKVSLKKH